MKPDPTQISNLNLQAPAQENSASKAGGKNFSLSIGLKITLFIFLATLTTALLILSMYYSQTNRIMVQKKIDHLEDQARILAPYFKSLYDQASRDALFLATMPPVQGIIRSDMNSGIDPIDGSPTDIWKDRFASIFVSLINARPEYRKVRYIGLSHNGREIIRVDKWAKEAERIPENKLQEKGREPFFQEGIKTEAGHVYFTGVTLNRENGRISHPPMPMIRAIVPVYTPGNRLYGLIVINVDYNQLVNSIRSRASKEESLIVTDERGKYLFYPGREKTMSFQYGSRDSLYEDFPILKQAVGDGKNEFTFFDEKSDRYIHFTKLFYNVDDPEAFLGIVLTADRQDILKDANTIRNRSFLLAFILTVMASAVTIWVARFFINPLNEVIAGVRAYDRGERDFPLPLQRRDEIGELARAFSSLTGNLEDLVQKFATSNEELERFAYICSHDLQEPLRMVRSYTQKLEQCMEPEKLGEKPKKYMWYVIDGATRAQNLINDILAYSRIDREDRNETVDLNATMKIVLHNLETLIAEKNAQVTYDTLPEIHNNPMMMIQLFQNLISNGIKYCTHRPEVHISVKKRSGRWLFSVKDNGIGIDMAYKDKIFLVFQRLHKKSEFSGTGIGLSICKKIVEKSGDRIWIESQAGQGTAFLFTLPCKEEEHIQNNERKYAHA